LIVDRLLGDLEKHASFYSTRRSQDVNALISGWRTFRIGKKPVPPAP
jgi:hypothetical protein